MKTGIFFRTKTTILHNIHFIVIYGMAVLFLPAIINYYSTVYFAKAVDQIIDIKFNRALLYITIYAFLMIVNSVFHTGIDYLFQSVKMKISNSSRKDILSRVSREMLVLFEDDKWLARFERIVGLSNVPTDFINNAIAFLSQLINIIFYFAYIYQYIGIHAVFFLLVFVPSLLKSFFITRMMTKAKREMNSARQLERKRFDLFLDSYVQSEERIFESKNFVYKKWLEISKKLHQTELYNNRRMIVLGLGMDFVMAAVAACLLFYLVMLTGINNISIGVVIALIPYIRNITSSADSAMNRLGSFYETVLEYKEIKAFYADYVQKKDIQDDRMEENKRDRCTKKDEKNKRNIQKVSVMQQLGGQKGYQIDVFSLNFSYPGSSREILHDINISIAPGEKVAVVGENGAGKSTLLKVLAGLYIVEDGHICYNGEDINVIPDEERNRKVSFIFQNILHYPANLKDNLIPGNHEAQMEQELIERLYQMDKSLVELCKEENVVMVSGYHDSKNISNGQWQKIGIIRALMKKDCKLFFFDEPTAALDPVSEVEVFNHFLEEIKDQTMLISTHRLGLAKKADRIIFLHNTIVEAVGTHEELMKICPRYAQMYESQAVWYQGGCVDVL